MGKFFDQLTPAHRDFSARQEIYFITTAPDSGRVLQNANSIGRLPAKLAAARHSQAAR